MDSISEIKAYLNTTETENLSEALELLRSDGREGVAKLVAVYDKELKRLEELCRYENALYDKGISLIAGIDEVGRGPLAGPVVACAVILPKNARIRYINDSKKLSEQRRKELYAEIQAKALAIGIGAVNHSTVDEINILQATFQAMRIALGNLSTVPERILIDAVSIPGVKIPQLPIVKGDAKSMSIAAASIIAKVTRDDMMCKYSEEHPEYGFDTNKGYGTQAHIEAIKRHGLCKIHRRSFVKNISIGIESNEDN